MAAGQVPWPEVRDRRRCWDRAGKDSTGTPGLPLVKRTLDRLHGMVWYDPKQSSLAQPLTGAQNVDVLIRLGDKHDTEDTAVAVDRRG